MNYARETYAGIEVQHIQMADDTYRVFDKPEIGQMMITSSLGSAAGQGLVTGATLGIVTDAPPLPRYEAAAKAWLTKTGRPNCRIISGYLLIRPQYELKYDCRPTVAAR